MVYGCTIIDLGNRLSEEGHLAPTLAVRGVASSVGNLLAGVNVDQFHMKTVWLFVIAILVESIGNSADDSVYYDIDSFKMLERFYSYLPHPVLWTRSHVGSDNGQPRNQLRVFTKRLVNFRSLNKS